MHIVPYTPAHFKNLQAAVEKMRRGRALAVDALVDHYYHANPWGQLWLALDDDESVVGTVGVESIPFALHDEVVSVGFGSNFHTLVEGLGGLLFLKWTRSNRHSMAYNNSELARKLTQAQRWQTLEGVVALSYNAPSAPTRSALGNAKRMVKHALRRPPLAKILERRRENPLRTGITVEEFSSFEGRRLDFPSPFDLRLAPDPAYFAWRFDPHWKCVRYRLFSIVRDSQIRGLVILHATADQTLVAHADGADPQEIAEGVLLSLAAVDGPNSLYLASSVPEITELCRTIGFKTNPVAPHLCFDRRFPLDSISRPLLHFGMGDNDLRVELMRHNLA